VTAALEVRHLTVSFGGLLAIDDVSFDVPAGGIAGLIGPNGAGKTTTIDALCGFVSCASGTVSLSGRPIEKLAAHRRARTGLVRTFQSVELFDDLTVRDNLLAAAAPSPWWGLLVDALAPRRRARGIDVEFALAAVGLLDQIDARPGELSHGQRRLVGVARALAAHPEVLLLDEPAAGLDSDETAALGALVKGLPERGIGVLLVDHDMTLVLDVCDTLTVLDLGRVIAHGPVDAVRNDPAVVAAYLGEVT
jgi:branched-chain amino acid transport system ATP-binding protein